MKLNNVYFLIELEVAMPGQCGYNGDRGTRRFLKVAVMIVVMALLATLSFCAAARADGGAPSKKVLFINSYSFDFETVPIVVSGVEQELDGLASIQYLYMDAKYVPSQVAEEQLKRQLDNVLAQNQYDLVILGDDPALDFAMKYRQRYFAGLPLVFEDVNSYEKARRVSQDPLITGLVESFKVKENIDLARKILPQAKNLVVISDNTESARGTVEQIFAMRGAYPDLAFSVLDTSAYTTEELKEKLSSYGPDTILFYSVFSIDASGRRYTISSGVRLVTSAARVPVFKADEIGVGHGLLGSYSPSYDSMGHKTGQIARAILQGQPVPFPQAAGVTTFMYKFDYNVMKRFGIEKKDLPVTAVYIHDVPDTLDLLAQYIVPLSLVLLAIIVGGLVIDRKQNCRFNKRLAEVEATRRAAEISDHAKTEFLSKMSHDIRTPLTAILGMTSLARDQVGDPEAMNKSLEKIESAGHWLLLLVNDILDMSKIESGKMELYPEPYPVDEFLVIIHNLFDPECAKKHIRFTVKATVGDSVILADKVRLNQVVCNLLSNAVKFTAPEGEISLIVTGRPDRTGHSQVDIIISDTGCGMTEAFQKHMFEPFTQDSLKRPASQTDGSGLGLAIVKNIVDLMDGTIDIDSAPGQGTTVRLCLHFPIAETAPASPDYTWTSQASLRGRRVLLVEDNALNTEIATLFLEKEGVIVDHAENGMEAVQQLEQADDDYYDAVLMDIRMPVMDGINAAKAIRRNQRGYLQHVPIIAMTADAFDDDVKRSLGAGMDAHLTKPVEPHVLYKVLLKYMKK